MASKKIVDRQLYKVTDDFRGLNGMLDDGVLTADDIADTLDAIVVEFEVKAIQIATVICNVSAPIPAIDDQIARLQARKKYLLSTKDWLIKYLMENMKVLNKKKIKGDLFDVTLAKGRDSVVIDNVDQLAKEFVTVKTQTNADKKAIKKALDNGEVVRGAHIETGDGSILIR